MSPSRPCILTVNGGSSSLKFALFRAEEELPLLATGKIERIGTDESTLRVREEGKSTETTTVDALENRAAVEVMLAWLAKRPAKGIITGTGHRVVHGGERYASPRVIDSTLCAELRRLSPLDPDHLPFSLELIEVMGRLHPRIPQVACFDTAFHRELPLVARLLPLPRRFFDAGVRRYGFHGLSYDFVLGEIERLAGADAADGRLVIAHLGSGASLAAVKGRKSLDTTMSFTPASGIPMGTRSGDLDPGVVSYLARTENMSVEGFQELVTRKSGLLGVSGSSSDVRDLLGRRADDPNAASAIDLFCYSVKKQVGAFAAALGGIDGLVFTGGVGENASAIRSQICAGLEFLGIHLDSERNLAGQRVISPDGSAVTVRVIHTDEERVIARATLDLLRTQDLGGTTS